MSEAADVELLERWRNGDAEAGEQLLARHFSSVYRFFAAQVGNDASDLTQQTFEACIVGRDRLRNDAAFRGYVFGVARNVLSNHIGKRRRHGEAVPLSRVSTPPLHSSPSGSLLRDEERRRLREAMAGLPQEVRPALEMFYLQERPLQEIAAALKVPVGTVKSRLFRGRGLLREALTSHPGDPLVRRALAAVEQASRELGLEDE